MNIAFSAFSEIFIIGIGPIITSFLFSVQHSFMFYYILLSFQHSVEYGITFYRFLKLALFQFGTQIRISGSYRVERSNLLIWE